MPESFEGKIQMAKIEQKLDDHIVAQNSDMGEVKSSLTRIELKLDAKVNKDEVEKINQAMIHKADKAEVVNVAKELANIDTNKANVDKITPIKEKVDSLENRIWYILIAVVLSIFGAIVSYVMRK